jgi:hypothetical protein
MNQRLNRAKSSTMIQMMLICLKAAWMTRKASTNRVSVNARAEFQQPERNEEVKGETFGRQKLFICFDASEPSSTSEKIRPNGHITSLGSAEFGLQKATGGVVWSPRGFVSYEELARPHQTFGSLSWQRTLREVFCLIRRAVNLLIFAGGAYGDGFEEKG